jgi:hypothetical protein
MRFRWSLLIKCYVCFGAGRIPGVEKCCCSSVFDFQTTPKGCQAGKIAKFARIATAMSRFAVNTSFDTTLQERFYIRWPTIAA